MGRPTVRGTTAINLNPSPTGLQKLPSHLWNCSGSDLRAYPAEEAGCTLLAAANHQDSLKGTELLLSLMKSWIQRKKAQMRQDLVKYLGFHISQGQQNLDAGRKISRLLNSNSNYKKTDP
jgi:hypothetical protein